MTDVRDQLIIYGASDDLVEVESTVFGAEEFNVYADGDQSVYLAVSDGTVLRVRYDEDGIWRFTPVVVGPTSEIDIQYGKDDHFHSDRVEISGENLVWAVLGYEIAK